MPGGAVDIAARLKAPEARAGAGVEKELRPVAFGKAVDLLAGTPAPLASPIGGEDGKRRTPSGLAGDKADAVAKRTHLDDAAKLTTIYDFDDDDVSLIVKRSVLHGDRAGATLEVALLYAAARQAAGYDGSHTKASAFRTRVDHMGVLDAGNFASTLTGKKDWFTYKGKGAGREFKVTAPGFEAAGKLVAKIAGGGT